ncbi:hypothetical protein WA026_011405 [Henosepilachna vigintioctopunctata]|uniref:Neutral ceramidase n=1 Tax=Henosepilachna vigintioctopunctata TaxID=420089 RepID=A0AAW1TJI0_9CUCU
MTGRVLWYSVFLLFGAFVGFLDATYQIGVGISDCTGPSAGITFMGYAKLSQVGCGIHLRQFARAFIFDDGNSRAAYVTVDTCMIPHGVKKEVISRLKKKFGDTYGFNNVILSGTHTHSTPGGFMMDLMYDFPDKGFVSESFMALSDGITQAFLNAHNNMVEGRIFLSVGEVLNANINRSPYSYLNNPEEERARYKYNTDKDLVQLKFVRASDNVPIGAINWFAVHPTSMNNTNCLVTSDNVGYASLQLEQYINGGTIMGKGPFVGAFASTNLGDVSPNIKGPKCIDTGDDCDFKTSTCNGSAKYCIASGPGDNMVESTKIIAERLVTKAKELFDNNKGEEVVGPIKYIHRFVDMPKQEITIKLANGTEKVVTGCSPAMGQGFAAGTTDGPGDFDFRQASRSDNPIWNYIRDLIFPPTEEDKACHSPKDILIASGRIKVPYQWQPEIVSTQLVMIGNVILAAVPGEFTTMSGRRLRESIKNAIIENGGPKNTRVVITGLSNVYTSYIATFEEYQVQRYEGASTIFGPHSLEIYQNVYTGLAEALLKDEDLPIGPIPPDFTSKLISFNLPVVFDAAPEGKHFGDCVQEPPSEVARGQTVTAKFIAGHPRNNMMHGKTFMAVEKLMPNNSWKVVYNDANWETRFKWKKTCVLKGTSEATIEWDIPEDQEPGTYRLRHFGNHKIILVGLVLPYSGTSDSFTVV